MHLRLVFSVTALVAAAHWAVLFDNFDLVPLPTAFTPDAPQRLHTVWIEQPTPATPPAPQVQAARPPPPQKTIAPRRPPAAPSTTAEPSQATVAAPANPEVETEAQAVATDAASAQAMEPATAPPQPTGPSLQVRNAADMPVTMALPADGSALAQHMALRFTVEGFVKGMQYHASAQLQWQTDGHTYQARQSISAFLLGSLEQTSTGLLTPQGLQPLQFVDRRLAKRRTVNLDWSAQQALFEPERAPTPIGPGTQDRLSVFLQLAAMLQAMPDLRAPGTRIDIPTLGARR
ncbi:MAG: hypothetical protein KBF33_13100, partial [Comamonas sp.]|nr:hypothetical protein [Comamonas sp.]